MKIPVTKPYLPDLKKYYHYLDSIWKSSHITNFGPLSCKLEEELCDYLGVSNLLLLSNGTIALQIAYKLSGLKQDDEVITTPFSFVATSSTLVWEKLKPIFCDINPQTLCIDNSKITNSITKNTKAILPVHVFGNPCEVEDLEKIAQTHNLKLIYDAAHAFGVKYKNTSVLNYGDISTLSFHATKIFHTIEGGAIVCRDSNAIKQAKEIINFGLKDSLPQTLGINAKNSEFHAAMGLCILQDIDYILEQRRKIWEKYHQNLKNHFDLQRLQADSENNFHYFPIIFKDEASLLRAINRLNQAEIYPRRYFYPSLDTLDFYSKTSNCTLSKEISKKILCLPLYVGLENEIQNKIITILLEA